MKKILVISQNALMPDQASGDLRLFSILELLGEFGKVILAINDFNTWRNSPSYAERYQAMYEKAGITLFEDTIYSALNSDEFDLIIFEFYHSAYEFIEKARYFQPRAMLVIDSVDVHFNRLLAKAALTGNTDDKKQAELIRSIELKTYQKADIVIAVSEEDKTIIQKYLPHKLITVLPNVHTIHKPIPRESREFGRLIFIGGFNHSPNVDAVLYFLNEIMPLIRLKTHEVKLSVIGSNLPPEIADIAMPMTDVDIIGYVPDTSPYLESAYISIAPLRYGGGMKGKVGEALSHGLPVVTTDFGAEGFGLMPGKDLIIANTPEQFADSILNLIKDHNYYNEISLNGYEFISNNYSKQAMRKKLTIFFDIIKNSSPSTPIWHNFIFHIKLCIERHVSWRLKKSST